MKEVKVEQKKAVMDASAQEAFEKKMAAGRASIPYIKRAMEKYLKPEALREIRSRYK